jgi:hypothetical protein
MTDDTAMRTAKAEMASDVARASATSLRRLKMHA